jgi:hypothetical protein
MEPRRYKLVPDDTQRDAAAPTAVRRRYSLARVAPSSRSALGVDRLERMEEIAAADQERRAGRPGHASAVAASDGVSSRP